MFGKKLPFLENWVTGQRGAFVGTIVVNSEKDHVKIKWVPMGSLKAIISEEIYPKGAIIHNIPLNTTLAGVPREEVYITEDTNGNAPHLDPILGKKKIEIAKYKEALQIQELESKKQKWRAKEAKEETSKQVARDRELNQRTREPQDDLFNLNRRRPGGYSSYMGNDNY